MTINHTSTIKNTELSVATKDFIITNATTNQSGDFSDEFCNVLIGMDLANAAYYGAKITLEKSKEHSKQIAFVSHYPDLQLLDELIKDIFNHSDAPDSGRFESEQLKTWLEKTNDQKLSLVGEALNDFFTGNSLYKKHLTLVSVKNMVINLDLSSCVTKAQFQPTLVKIEQRLRQFLPGVPLIVLIQEFEDANTKRK